MLTTHKIQGAGGVGGGGGYFLAQTAVSGTAVNVYGIDVNSSGDIVFGGTYSSNDIVGIVDAGGNLLVNKSFTNTYNPPSQCKDVKFTPSGNIVGLFDSASNDLLIEFQVDGTVNWSTFSDFSGIYTPYALAINGSSGDIYTIGSYRQSPYAAADWDILINRYSSSGGRQGSQTQNTGYYQFMNYADIGIDSSNNVYFSTNFYDLGAQEFGLAYVRKVSSTLSTSGGWVRTRGVTSGQYTLTHAAAVDSSDNVIIVGETPDPTFKSPYIIKFNSSGTEQWQRRLTHSLNDNISTYHVTTDASDNIYVGGTGGYFFKYNSSGSLLWQRKLVLSGTAQQINRIAVDDTNEAVLIAGTNCIAKLPADGSGTGTYGNFVYSDPSSFTSNTATLGQPYTTGSLVGTSVTDRASTSSSSDQAITLTTSTI